MNYSSNIYGKQLLDPRELQMLEGEMRRREKSLGIAFLLWILIPMMFIHRSYLGRGNAWLGVGIVSLCLFVFSWPLMFFLIGFLTIMVWGVLFFVQFIVWIIDAFSMSGWADEYNSRLENELLTQLLAAKGIFPPGPYGYAQPQQPAHQIPSISVNVAAASGGPAQAYGAPTAAYPQPTASSARLTYVESGRSATLMVNSGEQVLIGRDTNARVRLSDPKVSRQHALLQRSGSDWLVRDLGATNPTRLLGPGGQPQNIQGEIRVPSGQILVGDVLVTLFVAGV